MRRQQRPFELGTRALASRPFLRSRSAIKSQPSQKPCSRHLLRGTYHRASLPRRRYVHFSANCFGNFRENTPHRGFGPNLQQNSKQNPLYSSVRLLQPQLLVREIGNEDFTKEVIWFCPTVGMVGYSSCARGSFRSCR